MAPDAARRCCARLVACRSIAGGGNGELIAAVAGGPGGARARLSHVLDGTRAGVSVLHAVLGPADAAAGLLLAAHGDVVDVAGQRWTSDPFSLREADGRLHGRGATDMKGFLAAALAAMRASDPSSLRAPLHLALSHDEELGCAGVAAAARRVVRQPAPAPPAGVVVGEPTGLRVVDRHKGKAALRHHACAAAPRTSATPAAASTRSSPRRSWSGSSKRSGASWPARRPTPRSRSRTRRSGSARSPAASTSTSSRTRAR